MALEPILWALHDSPVNSTTDRMLLAGLAEKADADGTNAFPSRRTLARIALCDVKTVQRRLACLTEQGVITLGDQAAARYIPAHARPKVYDLQIPASWYGPERLARVNADRAQRGLPPLTQETRPALPPAPARTERSDKGKPRLGGGDSQSPPLPRPDFDRRGDCQSLGRGDSESRQGGLSVPQPSPLTLPVKETPTAPAARSADDARKAPTGSSARKAGGYAAPPDAAAPASATKSGKMPRQPMPQGQADAVKVVEEGWPPDLARLLPAHRPAVLWQAICKALDGGRTPQQLLERIQRRWWTHGYARALAEGKISSPVGVAVGLVRPSTDCPDPMCEDGTTLHTEQPCTNCIQRRADRRYGHAPTPGDTFPRPQWWECEGKHCTAAGKGPRPDTGLCWRCQDQAELAQIQHATAHLLTEAETAQQAQRLRQTIRRQRTLDDTHTEHTNRTRTTPDSDEADHRPPQTLTTYANHANNSNANTPSSPPTPSHTHDHPPPPPFTPRPTASTQRQRRVA
ncbi:helix-turn-helix domain-containing protein [Streptomyces subrutilus]|uniref:helix-turn-helix domain-containing protein n=1 Tax=Streptomyces subrutilus TaxID=36818 RepID=UPI000B0BB295